MNTATWLRSEPESPHTIVDQLLPGGFETYLRLFPPAVSTEDEASISWERVSSIMKTRQHASAEWGSVARKRRIHIGESWNWITPRPGGLSASQSIILAEAIERSVCTSRLLVTLSTNHLNHAELANLAEFQSVSGNPKLTETYSISSSNQSIEYLSLAFQGPSIVWSKNNDLCIRIDEDLITPYLGCSSLIGSKIIADRRLEITQVSPNQRFSWDSDRVNPLPDPPEL